VSESLLLSVVVPVYNQAESILANVDTILERIGSGLGEPFELIVVSDGSVDRTQEQLLEHRDERVRVFHYDRNLGKGYALKLGGLQARGRWIGFVDADLDLDPAAIPRFLRRAESRSLDLVIGSKRHPDSIVHYPFSRRVASWLYQQLVHLLFRLDVRDTQVGLKVFRREIADEVLPLLLVKRFAFDLELLAVSRSLGFSRIEEQPIDLHYRFTGSGVGSLAVLRALVDTAAIFYRLRVLRYYERKRQTLVRLGSDRASFHTPLVTLLAPPSVSVSSLDYANVERGDPSGGVRSAVEQAKGELLAFAGDGAVPAGNWLSATVPFFARAEVAAVVTPRLAPSTGTARARAAAAVQESRLGGGSLYYRFTPGNLRIVRDYPADEILVRREVYLELAADVPAHELAERISDRGGTVVYTPETVVVSPVPPLIVPHLRRMAAYGRRRGRALRSRGLPAARLSTVLVLSLWLLVLAVVLVALGRLPARVLVVIAVGYGGAISLSAFIAMLRFRSASVGLLALLAFPLTHAVYGVSFVRGAVGRR
jgi:glycosyltransferase involved in cell wall biosynthesis